MKTQRGLFPRAVKIAVLTVFFLALLLIFDPTGLSNEDSFVMPPGVRELAVLEVEPELISVANTSQDFDGDGVVDVVFYEWPIRGLSGLVSEVTPFVDSGRTGERLFELEAGPGGRASWYGDYDNNGTMDIVFKRGERWHVWGFVAD